jgi:hypothetical protein
MVERWYSESQLATHLGITRSTLENFRSSSLKKNDAKKIGRSLFISEPALQKLLRSLGSEGLDCSDCLEKNGAEPPSPEPEFVELTVTRVYPNPHVIEACLDETGELVRVSVMSNTNFRPRMKIKARQPVPDGPQLYRLEGRCPRFPGRW